MSANLEQAQGRADYSHAAFVDDAGGMLERAYQGAAQAWLEAEYGRPVPLEVRNKWRNPRGDKRGYLAHEYTDSDGRPRLRVIIRSNKSGEIIRFDDYGEVFEPMYRDWLERRRALTAEERSAWEARRAEREQAAAQAAHERTERAEQARLEAMDDEERRDANVAAERELWGELPEDGRSAYLVRKELPHVAPFRYEAQTLVLPMWSATGEFAGVQRITSKGRKLFTDGARKKGALTVLGGPPEQGGRVDLHNLPRFIAEGVATAVRPHQVTGEPVIVAYDAHNLTEVIRDICAALFAAGMEKQRRAWLRRLVICADNDAYKTEQLHNGVALGNVGLEAAHAAAFEANRFGVRVACPDFTGLSEKSKPTDFDDLARLAGLDGLDVVRAQLEAATLPDPKHVFAKRKREYLKDHAARGGTFAETVSLDDLKDGLTVVQSPQNTQKTRSLIPVVEQCRAEGHLFIYVTHRVALAADAARKLGLELYSDYDRGDLSLMRGLAITVNSLRHLEDAAGNLTVPHTLVIDESEQAIPALAGAHMRDKTANMRVLSRLVGRAQRVVCLDADAGEMTRWLFSTWRGGERVNWICNHWDVGKDKTAYVYPHRAQLYAQLQASTYAATDSLAESRRMAFTLEAVGVRAQLINGETSHDADNLTFIADMDRYAPTVGAIVASPTVSTGVSLTDPGYTQAVGVFYGANGPATEALQSLWRPRRATELHLWVQPSSGQGERIDLEARYGAALDAELERVGKPDRPTSGDDHGYGNLKRLVAESKQRARRTYADDLIWLMVRQGIDVQLAEHPKGDAPALREVLTEARDRERAAYADERFSAEQYDRATAEALRERGTLTSRERFGLERFDHTEFFRNADAENLKTWLQADYRGRYRLQLERLELTLLKDEESARAYAAQLLDRVEMRADTPLTLTRREFSQRVLEAVGFDGAVQALKEALTPGELDVAAQVELERRGHVLEGEQEPPPIVRKLRNAALEKFARYSLGGELVQELLEWIEANRPVLAGVVALPTPDELRANAVRYIRSWLKPLGLRQARVGKNARGEYVLDGAALALAAHVLERQGGDTFSKASIYRKSVPRENAVSDAPVPMPPPDPEPPTDVNDWLADFTGWLEAGKLDDFGPQKLTIIRERVAENNTGWLYTLATSLETRRMLGAVQ